jgi:hypothetical protein
MTSTIRPCDWSLATRAIFGFQRLLWWPKCTPEGRRPRLRPQLRAPRRKISILLARAASADVTKAPDFEKFIDDVAMQVAAIAPQWLTKDDVPEADKKKQAEIFDAQFAEDPKAPPPERRAGAVQGKVGKWMKEVVLLEQPSVVETDKSIEQVRAAVSKTAGGEIELVKFVRYERGEGVEKPQGPDVASEVAKMAGGVRGRQRELLVEDSVLGLRRPETFQRKLDTERGRSGCVFGSGNGRERRPSV